MKRLILVLLMMVLCLPVAALADELLSQRGEDPQEPEGLPAEVQALLDEYNGARLSVQHVSFLLADGGQVVLTLSEGGSIVGFECQNGEWHATLMTSTMGELRPACLEYAVGDDLGFHLTSADTTTRLTYRFDGEQFRLVGWVIPGYRPVTVDGDTLTYGGQPGAGDDAFQTVLPGGVTDWPWSPDDLPLTPEEAMARAVITEQNAAETFPGYTLRRYAAYNDGRMAEAAYSRITNGVLLIKRVVFEAGMEPRVMDCMPVPLSENLLSRLETEPFDSLISCRAGESTFLTQDAFSTETFPLPEGAVLGQNRVEENSLVALVEMDGAEYLYVFERGANPVRVTQALPEDVYIDFFHAGDGNLQFEWAEQNMTASFVRRADGEWQLSWCTCYGPSADIHFTANAFGVIYHEQGGSDRMQVGTLAGGDLFSIRLSDLNGATPDLDQTGWAVVSNPDPADRLHLRTEADKASRSQGKFYNGTPVRVLRQRGDWTEVQIGFGTTARTGWMMTKYLAFDFDMDKVKDAFPELIFREEYSAEESEIGYGYWVAGVEENGSQKQYVLLGADGTVIYVPQSWLWAGNG